MSVKVRCPGCEKVLSVPDAARGKAVKCPQCDTRIPVPAGEAPRSAKTSSDKPKKKPAVAKSGKKPADSEDFLASLDLRRAEDANARICSKCGFDMQDVDEEETECPKCGFDIEAGGMGVKAKKRAMKGPDPADFFPGLAKNAWNFMVKNQSLAWRTDVYVLVCLLISMCCAFMYLWLSAWPPRYFFALCFFVSFLVIPGWLWVLDTEVIKLTLERKDKFKKLNFDFFLSSAKGVMFVGWLVLVGAPVLLIPGGIGYYMVNYSGSPPFVMGICLAIGAIPLICLAPATMSHMTMPISFPGWMVWKLVQYFGRTAVGSLVWVMWLLLTSLPLIGGAAVIGGVWGADIETIVRTMESNADINRRLLEIENAPSGKNAPPKIDPATVGKPADVDFKPLIGPAIVLVVMCLPLGFIGLFNMRTNGQYTYFFRERLDLIDKAKEYKYVAKERRRDDDDDEPKTLQQDLVEALVLSAVCFLFGAIGGTLYGVFTVGDILPSLMIGITVGIDAMILVAGFMMISAAFAESPLWGIGVLLFGPVGLVFLIMHFEKVRKTVFMVCIATVAIILLVILFAAGLIVMTKGPAV